MGLVRIAIAALAVTSAADARPVSPPPTPPPPLLAPTFTPMPNDEVYGDWTLLGSDSELHIARTDNNAGSTFGVMCMGNDCYSFLRIDVDCIEGHKYPALVNAPSAAYSVELLCEKIDKTMLYSLPLAGAITDAMSVGGEIGFAFPMQSGQFKVVRFSLTGAARAAAQAAQYAKRGQAPARKAGSDNSVL